MMVDEEPLDMEEDNSHSNRASSELTKILQASLTDHH